MAMTTGRQPRCHAVRGRQTLAEAKKPINEIEHLEPDTNPSSVFMQIVTLCHKLGQLYAEALPDIYRPSGIRRTSWD